MVVAMDGTAGSGKSSASRGVARRLGLRYLDTGAMYRAMTWKMLLDGVDVDDPDAVAEHAPTGRHRHRHEPRAPDDHPRRGRRVPRDQVRRRHGGGQRGERRSTGARAAARPAAGHHRTRRHRGRGTRHRHRGRAGCEAQGLRDRRSRRAGAASVGGDVGGAVARCRSRRGGPAAARPLRLDAHGVAAHGGRRRGRARHDRPVARPGDRPGGGLARERAHASEASAHE